ncbi:hypothetical protein I2I05_21155 [Hymenobacter sp. BT683]|uniref:Uncharacterized protein n=1 Tax=Hymenobacter jeongseonensis TaxID=2791027 RepID=A0ABS0IPD4_9BACT|nr:hypothetical protein [Hymenobacter jeongseonensis]MBF9239914.1 hypothetical protein [Hymenobacter jeongseonensis]
MSTQNTPNPPDNDFRPEDQQERAASARPNPNDPILNAQRPNYGEFGGINPTDSTSGQTGSAVPTAQAPGRDGSNDNPDEFSEFRSREKDARDAPANPADQPGHVEQNQDPAAVRATQGEDNDEQRAAWAKDDPRWAGGGSHNTRDESASTDTHK